MKGETAEDVRRGRLDDGGVENGRVSTGETAGGEKSLGFNVGFLRGIGLVVGSVPRSVDVWISPEATPIVRISTIKAVANGVFPLFN